MNHDNISVVGAREHNLKDVSLEIPRNKITVITGVSGSGKSSLAFDTVLAESQRRFFYTLSNYSRQFLDLGTRPKVKSISGLSPAISLEQNETQPSRRATVATITDVSELLGVLFARFGEKNCPDHNLPTTSLSLDQLVENVLRKFSGQLVAVTAPIVEDKKGVFRAPLTKALTSGCQRAFVDGEVVHLDPIPKLEREYKHTIKVVTDYVKATNEKSERVKRALRSALEMNDGYAEVFLADSSGQIDLATVLALSTTDGCTVCGYAWPRLDARNFSANSLGQCRSCHGYGLDAGSYDIDTNEDLAYVKSAIEVPCSECGGCGIDPKYAAIKIAGNSIADLYGPSIRELLPVLDRLMTKNLEDNKAFIRVHDKIKSQLSRLIDVGLDYVDLGRRVLSLSGGEGQRLKLAGILAEQLRGVLYVLDEPSQGLHPTELENIWTNILNLKKAGNTVIIVDHDNVFIEKADLVIDLGPGGGRDGGNIQAIFEPKDMAKYGESSETAKHMLKLRSGQYPVRPVPETLRYLTLKNVRHNNLDIPKVSFLLNCLNVVTGVSGAGKTSLVFGVVVPNLEESAPYVAQGYELEDDWYNADIITGYDNISSLVIVDRKPVAKSSVSMPATYLDCFKYLRDLYAKLPDSQIYGLTAKHYSFASDLGRCPECKGRGIVTLSMKFLADAKEVCTVCEGKRYQEEVLAVKYKGYSLSEILDLTIQEVYEVFANHKQIEKRLRPAIELGLGYLKFGQPSSSLSGGEAQRLKLVPLLSKQWGEGSMLILDEPTRGLHFKDVELLKNSLRNLVDQGTTVVMIEHHSSFLREADWIVDLGPGSSKEGGKVVYQGFNKDFSGAKDSITARALYSL